MKFKLPKIRHHELVWTIVLFLLILIWLGLSRDWYLWYIQEGNLKCLKELYFFLDGRWLVNIPICVILSYLACRYISYLLRDEDIRYYRPIMLGLAFSILYCGTKDIIVYAEIAFGFDYREFLSVLLAIIFLAIPFKRFCVQLSKIIKEPVQIEKDKDDKKCTTVGFSGDNLNDENIPDNLKQYSAMIVDRLMATNVEQQSFAVGVTGEWGVGKTSFLHQLKKDIDGRADVVEFNPWMCRSPEQVTQDFFASLRHQLSPIHSILSKPIKEYAKYLNDVTFSGSQLLGFSINFSDQDSSLHDKKKKLSEQFALLPRPVVVIIDDIDRLEREEVFEVLRLIRNTADLKNTIYLVAFDKEYVTSVLEEKRIKDAASYLEKIFQVEVPIPKVQDYLIWDTLKKELEAQDTRSIEKTKALFGQLDGEKEVILSILDNYRRAKRFARLFMLHISYLDDNSNGEINLLDLFCIELLQTYDKKTYDTLASDYGVLLYNDVGRLKIRQGVIAKVSEKDSNAYTGERFWKEKSSTIIKILFDDYRKADRKSICYMENYEKYFTLGVSPFRLSNKELRLLFTDGSVNPEEVMDEWLKHGKYISSIIYQLKQFNVNRAKKEYMEIFVRAILWLGLRIENIKYGQIGEVKKMLKRHNYHTNTALQYAHDIMMSWFKGHLNDEHLIPSLSSFLNFLYVTQEYDDDNIKIESSPLVISNEEIKQILLEIVNTFLKNHSNDLSAEEVLKPDSDLGIILKNCCIMEWESVMSEEMYYYEQVAFDTIINHFAAQKEKPSLSEYDKAYRELTNIGETPIFASQQDKDAYWDYMNTTYENNLIRHFGNKYSKKLDEFKNKCFVSIN